MEKWKHKIPKSILGTLWGITAGILLIGGIADYCIPDVRTCMVAAEGSIASEETVALWGVVPLKKTKLREWKEQEVMVGGMPFGIQMQFPGLLVTETGEVEGTGRSPAKEAGIRKGDLISEINGITEPKAKDIEEALSKGEKLTMKVLRGEKALEMTVEPVRDTAGQYKAGLWLKEGTAGLGTVTYILPETGAFGGLGHGVTDPETGELYPMQRGTAYAVKVEGANKGLKGIPGELRGTLMPRKLGLLWENTGVGMFGALARIPEEAKSVSIGWKEEVHDGKATILSTVDGEGVRSYEVLLSAVRQGDREGKNFAIRVTDPVLLEKTGGIVQGMSGSPVIQDGKLIGAVTHVLISDPAMGYGIFIENMLAEMPQTNVIGEEDKAA